MMHPVHCTVYTVHGTQGIKMDIYVDKICDQKWEQIHNYYNYNWILV